MNYPRPWNLPSFHYPLYSPSSDQVNVPWAFLYSSLNFPYILVTCHFSILLFHTCMLLDHVFYHPSIHPYTWFHFPKGIKHQYLVQTEGMKEEGLRGWWVDVSFGFLIGWFRRTQYITSIVLFYKNWRFYLEEVSNCEELVGVAHRGWWDWFYGFILYYSIGILRIFGN